MSVNLKLRSFQPEQMDDFDSQGEIIHKTLHELDFINKWLGGYQVTKSGINLLLNDVSSNEYYIADIGCGGGGTLNQIRKWGDQKKYKLKMFGIDANPHIIQYAKESSGNSNNIYFITGNVLDEDLSGYGFDIINCTLLIHHFNDQQLINFLKKIKGSAKIGIVINDLHRHWFAYHSIRILTRIFSGSAMVINDAPLSVMRAFKKSDLIKILTQAGIDNFDLRWKWAFRWQLVIRSNQ